MKKYLSGILLTILLFSEVMIFGESYILSPNTSSLSLFNNQTNITSNLINEILQLISSVSKPVSAQIKSTSEPFPVQAESVSELFLSQSKSTLNQFSAELGVIIFLSVLLLFLMQIFNTRRFNHMNQKLKLEQQRFAAALSQLKGYIWEYDTKKDTICFFNTSAKKSEINQSILHPRTYMIESKQIYSEDYLQFYDFFDSLVLNDSNNSLEFLDVPSISSEFRILDLQTNTYQWYQFTGTKIFDSKRNPITIIGHCINIELQKQELESLKQKAGQDSLTLLFNSSLVEEQTNKYISKIEEPVICALYLIDVDNFKQINDMFGHLFGDGLLIDISTKLKTFFSSSDIIGRMGGDEFIVFEKNIPSVEYMKCMADKILDSFQTISIFDSDAQHITGSIGISLYPMDGITFTELYKRAASALYYSKTHGKAQYMIYSEQMISDSADSYKSEFSTTVESQERYENRSLIDLTMLANAIDILFDSRDLDPSIYLLLSLTASYYKLDRLNILEYSENNTCINCTYEWTSKTSYQIKQTIQNLPIEEGKQYFLFMTNSNGIFYTNDIEQWIEQAREKEEYQPYLAKRNDIKALYQCGLASNGSYFGYLTAASCDGSFIWEKNIVDTLTLLSRLIGSYLINYRTLQRTTLKIQKDSLIDAYNFNTFLDKVNEQFIQFPEVNYAMIYSDISQFKLINDNYGYQTGDEILIQLSKIFHDISKPDGLLCRITGDKFALLLSYTDKPTLEYKIKTILAKSRQIEAPNHTFYRINLMIGIYLVKKGDKAIAAVDKANIAKKNVLATHQGTYAYFTSSMHSALLKRKEVEDVMDSALCHHEFKVYYQPKINLSTGELRGAEALVRWNRPGHGLVPPDSFIPLFEENEFIIPLDYYVLENVCFQLRERIDKGKKVCPVSVNFSRVHFNKDVLPNVLLETVNNYNISPSLIEVEITESILSENDQFLLSILNKIKKYGFRISMDDFGSGLSSLNMLSTMPFHSLKIDKDFFHTNAASIRERIVISNIVRMALELEMEVICEGVETKEQEKFLQSIHCNTAQGYFYSKPLPLEEFEKKYWN